MKKYFIMILAIVFVFVLAGCNGTVHEEQNDNDMIRLEEIIAGIRIGMSRAEAEQLLGEAQRVGRAYGSGHSYRHDVMCAEGYSFVCEHGLDTIDGEGLTRGLVRLIVFFDYDENDAVAYYTLYYSGADGMIYEARNRGDEHGRVTAPRPDMLAHGDDADWNDLGVISIPSTWTYTVHDAEPGPFSIDILGEGAGGLIHMAVWSVMAGDPYMVANEFSSQQKFAFDDGHSGYMLEGHLFESDTLMTWLQTDRGIALSLYYDGNDAVFAENQELILQIARTLTYD